jgi:hypothetical protein
VLLEILPPGSPPTLTVTSSPDGLIVTIGLPDTAQELDLNQIVALSWIHNAPFPGIGGAGEFTNLMNHIGIAVEFAQEVAFDQFTGRERSGPSMLVELQRRRDEEDETFCWCPIRRINVFPLEEVANDGNGLITAFNVAPGRATSKGFALIANDIGFRPGETLRVLIHADFIIDVKGRPLDGNHIGGSLPTGNGQPGNDFLSWFTLPGEQ